MIQLTVDQPLTRDRNPMGTTHMLMPEALARARMQAAEQAARDYRDYHAARRQSNARSWQRLADWASDRATRARVDD